MDAERQLVLREKRRPVLIIWFWNDLAQVVGKRKPRCRLEEDFKTPPIEAIWNVWADDLRI